MLNNMATQYFLYDGGIPAKAESDGYSVDLLVGDKWENRFPPPDNWDTSAEPVTKEEFDKAVTSGEVFDDC
jgi:hypothetical protein